MNAGGPQSYAAADARERVPPTRCAFVSTNSITQGEQVAPLWRRMNAEIDFAYQTFKWHNEAKNNVAVHCVIIGFHAKEPRAEVQRHGELLSLRGDLESRSLGEDSKKSPSLQNSKTPSSESKIPNSTDADRVAHLFRLYAEKVKC